MLTLKIDRVNYDYYSTSSYRIKLKIYSFIYLNLYPK